MPHTVSDADLKRMRRIDALHLDLGDASNDKAPSPIRRGALMNQSGLFLEERVGEIPEGQKAVINQWLSETHSQISIHKTEQNEVHVTIISIKKHLKVLFYRITIPLPSATA